MRSGPKDATIGAMEIHTRPPGRTWPTRECKDYFAADEIPCRGAARPWWSAPGSDDRDLSAHGQTASMRVAFHGRKAAPDRHFLRRRAPRRPDAAAQADLDALLAEPLEELESRRNAWWRRWWDKSSLLLTGPDPMADRLCGAYHVHLYTLGCTNRGPVPCKWDGGPGLMRGDERTWGLAEWVQEIRFTYMPLYAANRLEMANGLTDHYTRMRPYLGGRRKRCGASTDCGFRKRSCRGDMPRISS